MRSIRVFLATSIVALLILFNFVAAVQGYQSSMREADALFDNQMLAQIWYAGYEIAEITCPTKYFDDASSINMKNSSIYGIGVLRTSIQYRLQKWGISKNKIFKPQNLNK